MSDAAAARDRLGPMLETAGAWWRWWTGELAAMLPRGAAPPVLLADPDAAGGFRFARRHAGAEAAFAGDPAAAGLPLWLRLPETAALTRVVEWPVMPPADLRRALVLDLDRQTPCAAETLWFDMAVAGRDAARRRLSVEFVVAHAAEVKAMRAALQARHGVAPARICIAGTDGAPCFDLRPAAAQHTVQRAARGLLPNRLRARLLLLCAVLGAVNFGLHREAEQARGEALDAAVLDARRRAQRVEALRSQVTEKRQLRDDLRARRGDVGLLAVLDQLTRLLPDEAWLETVEVRGGNVYVTGHAPVAATLVAQIETSPMFADAQFRSPVTPDRARGRERFDMVIRLRGRS